MTYVKTDLTGYSKIKTGFYPGNNTANRGIAHGLGTTPLAVIFTESAAGHVLKIIKPDMISYTDFSGEGHLAVTSCDATNFYVGNATSYAQSANNTGKTYYWVAYG